MEVENQENKPPISFQENQTPTVTPETSPEVPMATTLTEGTPPEQVDPVLDMLTVIFGQLTLMEDILIVMFFWMISTKIIDYGGRR